MKTIFKYPLKILDEQEIDMPAHAMLLTVQVQNDLPCLWALVNTDNPVAKQKILMRGTGHPAEGVGRYLSTFQLDNGRLVFHVFEPFDLFKSMRDAFV